VADAYTLAVERGPDRRGIDAGAAVGNAKAQEAAGASPACEQPHPRRFRVSDPEPEGELAGGAAARRVEDDVVGTSIWTDGSDRGREAVVSWQVWIQVQRQAGVPGQAVLVARADDASLHARTSSVGEDDDAEVRDRPRQRESEDLLGPAQARRDVEPRGIRRGAVAANARRPAGRVAAVESGPARA